MFKSVESSIIVYENDMEFPIRIEVKTNKIYLDQNIFDLDMFYSEMHFCHIYLF